MIIEGGKFGHRDTYMGRTPREYKDRHPQSEEEVLKHILPSEPSEGFNLANTSISNLQTLDL